MNCDDMVDHWMLFLCDCDEYSQCEWHRRLRKEGANRRELAEEMQEIVETSHGVAEGEMDLPEGWELIPGKLCMYWAPADRGR